METEISGHDALDTSRAQADQQMPPNATDDPEYRRTLDEFVSYPLGK